MKTVKPPQNPNPTIEQIRIASKQRLEAILNSSLVKTAIVPADPNNPESVKAAKEYNDLICIEFDTAKKSYVVPDDLKFWALVKGKPQ